MEIRFLVFQAWKTWKNVFFIKRSWKSHGNMNPYLLWCCAYVILVLYISFALFDFHFKCSKPLNLDLHMSWKISNGSLKSHGILFLEKYRNPINCIKEYTLGLYSLCNWYVKLCHGYIKVLFWITWWGKEVLHFGV